MPHSSRKISFRFIAAIANTFSADRRRAGPECGLAFDRGRLLVDQYLRLKTGAMRRWRRRWLWFLLSTSLLIGGLPLLFTYWPQTIPSVRWLKWTWTITAVGWTIYGIGLLTFATVAIRDMVRTRSQRRRILAALRASGGNQSQANESRFGC